MCYAGTDKTVSPWEFPPGQDGRHALLIIPCLLVENIYTDRDPMHPLWVSIAKYIWLAR